MTDAEQEPGAVKILHASCVALKGRGLLITGASGVGKSGLSLQLMALGADLVADDRTALHIDGGRLMANPAPGIARLIEMRGLGLLRADHIGPVPLHSVVDLDQEEGDRLPFAREIEILGITLPLLRRVDSPVFSAALIQYLKSGRHRP